MINQLPSRQRGIAMVIAISIMMIGVITATTLLSKQQLSLRKGSNLIMRDQAAEYNLAAEKWAKIWLTKDDNQNSYAGEDWASELPPLPVDGGVIVARLYDLQGRININSFVAGADTFTRPQNPPPGYKTPHEQQQALYAELALQMNIISREANIIDWIDKDDNPTASVGAESNTYMGLERPYRAANQEALTITELRLLSEVNDEEYRFYREPEQDFEDPRMLLTALPGYTNINLNFAPASLFVALGLDPIEAEQLIEEIEVTPFEDSKDIDTRLQQYGVKIGATTGPQVDYVAEEVFTAESEYFLLVSKTFIGRTQSILYSVIYREPQSKRCHIINRSYGTI